MVIEYLIALVVGYIVCGLLAYGLDFASIQRGVPTLAAYMYWADWRFSVFFGLFGSLGLIAVFWAMVSFRNRHHRQIFYGLKWK